MGRLAKVERNDQIVTLRNKDPKKYTFPALGGIFKLKKETVHEIYHREMDRRQTTV